MQAWVRKVGYRGGPPFEMLISRKLLLHRKYFGKNLRFRKFEFTSSDLCCCVALFLVQAVMRNMEKCFRKIKSTQKQDGVAFL